MRSITPKHIVALLVLTITWLSPSESVSSEFGWSGQVEAICANHRGPYSNLDLRYLQNAATCTANCYSYTLVCADGAKFPVSSRYPPHATDTEVFMYENGAGAVITKLAIFGGLAFYSAVAFFGTKREREIAIYAHGGFVALIALTLYLWGTGAVEEYHWSLGRPLDYILGSVTAWIVLPLFVVLNVMSFVRGWNYLFVAHPAAPIVRPATRGQAADVEGLADVLVEGAEDAGEHATFHYEHQTEKARALARKLNEDSAVAEARIERALRRAELAEAEQALAEARKRKGKSG
jgi:hypothetical protein